MSDYQELVENVSAGGRTTNGNMGFFYCAGCDGVHVRLFYRSWFCDVAAGKPEYFGCETMCISGTQTEDDTYGADLFFYTSFF